MLKVDIMYGSMYTLYCWAQAKHSNSQSFENALFMHILYLTKHFYLVSKHFRQKIVANYFFAIKLYTSLTYTEL